MDLKVVYLAISTSWFISEKATTYFQNINFETKIAFVAVSVLSVLIAMSLFFRKEN